MDGSAAEALDQGARTSTALRWGVRSGLAAYGVVHLLVCWVALRLVFGDPGGRATGQRALAPLAGDPLGAVMLAALAVGFSVLALWQLIAAVVGYRDLNGWRRHLMRAVAGARVAAYGYLAFAGLDRALREVLGGRLGGPAIVVTALGIGCFGLYHFARARHLDEDSITS